VEIAESEKRPLLETTEKMIKDIADAGADAVKFQIYTPDGLADKKEIPEQFEYLKKHALLTFTDYDYLIEICKKNKIEFIATLFTDEAIEYFGPKLNIFKISSPDITNKPMLMKIGKFGKPVILSTAGSTLVEISDALNWIGNVEIAILHCTGNYPTMEKDVNFAMIRNLNDYFSNVVGYSDHINQDTFLNTPLYAFLVGANIIEKHFTFNRFLTGNDHWHSLTSSTLRANIRLLSEAQKLLGNYHKTTLDSEISFITFGRRSLATKNDIKKGQIIKEEDLIALRPGTGILPFEIDKIIGCKAKNKIDKNTILYYTMISEKNENSQAY
jgi:N-acetylneuraminate synthase